jgi:hypothetical protein
MTLKSGANTSDRLTTATIADMFFAAADILAAILAAAIIAKVHWMQETWLGSSEFVEPDAVAPTSLTIVSCLLWAPRGISRPRLDGLAGQSPRVAFAEATWPSSCCVCGHLARHHVALSGRSA